MTIESLIWFVLVLAVIGLIVGAVARVLVPGPTSMGVLATIGAGIAGAFIGGFIGRLPISRTARSRNSPSVLPRGD